jgi:signal transduction histidine kinase
MLSLFTRIYLIVLLTLIMTALTVVFAMHQVNKHRFTNFTEHRKQALAALININSEAVTDDRLSNWLAIVSRLTGTDWRLVPVDQDEQNSQWWTERATITVVTGRPSIQLIEAQVTDWDELLVGTGFLMVNALSLVPALERDQHLESLETATGISATPVAIDAEPLGFLQQRQLAQGQAVITSQNQALMTPQQCIYVPMGQGNALRLGPVEPFTWLTPLGLLLVTGLVLSAVGAIIYGALLPLKRRISRMILAVDAIQHTPSSVAVPEQPADELGTMGLHINRMAAGLVRLAQRNRDVNQAVSHDLKTPLAQLKFALELLKPERQQAYVVEKMNQSISDMEMLVDELLLYQSLAEPLIGSKLKNIDLTALVPLVIDSLVCPGDLEYAVDLPPAPLYIAGEERLVRRLLGNLLSNACHYGNSTVNLTARKTESGEVLVTIEDDGPGIPDADKQRVFEPFYRLDRTREADIKGHGLGLAISLDIVINMGGEIAIEDCNGGGCRVLITFPPPALHSQTKK